MDTLFDFTTKVKVHPVLPMGVHHKTPYKFL